MQQSLETLDAEFQSHHHDITDITDNESSLSKEQESLDEHNDITAELVIHIKWLIGMCMASNTTTRKIATRRLAHVQKALSEMSSTIAILTGDSNEVYLPGQFEK